MSALHTVLLTTRDGHTLSFECGEEESLLAGAERHGLTLPAVCRQGGCGACRAQADAGPFELIDHSLGALSAEAAARGELLLCCSFPRGPLAIRIDQERAALERGPLPERRATVAAIEAAAEAVVRLELLLTPDEQGNGAEFEPGQYMELSPPDRPFFRAYSIANTPNWEGRLEFYIRLQPHGRFSEWLRQARPGAELRVRGPAGGFVLEEESLAERWFIAGGTGLAPVLSMLRWMGELGAASPARLYFGVGRSADLFAAEALAALHSQLPDLTVERCVGRAAGDWSGFVGTPLAALERDLGAALAAGRRPDLYVCGPAGLVDAVERLARALGLADRLRGERFLPG